MGVGIGTPEENQRRVSGRVHVTLVLFLERPGPLSRNLLFVYCVFTCRR